MGVSIRRLEIRVIRVIIQNPKSKIQNQVIIITLLAALEGGSGSSLVAYLLEKAMDDWDELRRSENAQPVSTPQTQQ